MKPSFALRLSALSLGLAALAFPARADNPSQPPVPPATPAAAKASPADGTVTQPPPHRRRGFVLARLTEKLGLTVDQQKTIGGFIADGRSQAREVRDDDSLSDEDRRAKLRAILEATRGQIRAALTPDQQKQFDALPRRWAAPKSPDAN
jgi:hypothetical protein